MKKAMLVAFVAAMAIPSVSSAVTSNARNVLLSGLPAGTTQIFPYINIDGPTRVCQYYMDWQSPLGAIGGSQPCLINEQKTLLHTSCAANAFVNFTSMVTSVPGCRGFDYTGTPRNVALQLFETEFGGALSGVALVEGNPLYQSIDMR